MLLRGFTNEASYHGCFVAIGNFDGVHRGHQAMIARLVDHAQKASVPAVALTFDPHPIQLLRPELAPPSLSILERKAELLVKCGVNAVIAYPTDAALLSLTADEFFQQIVLEKLQATGMVEGPNFFFGKSRQGDVNTLAALCSSKGLTLDIAEPTEIDGRLVSSSVIRSLISQGELQEAVDLLGHPYRVRGTVESGAQRGRTIGFPTANLGNIATLLPPNGVYAGIADVNGTPYPAAINLGPNPTFGDRAQKFEAHLIGFDGDLYGHVLDIDFVAKIRSVINFNGVEKLQQQLQLDVDQVTVLAKPLITR